MEEWCDKYTPEVIVEELNILYYKYKYMEAQVLKHNEAIKNKTPDIEKALETIEYLQKKNKEPEPVLPESLIAF